MATIGNNMGSKNQEVRDAFLTDLDGNIGAEGQYVEKLNDKIKKGATFDVINCMDFKDYYLIVKEVKTRIRTNDSINGILKTNALKIWECLTTNEINANILSKLYASHNPDAKRVLSETLIAMVEEGRFDEEQMLVIENLLGILLSSIEDLHLEQGLELYPDVELGR